MGFKDSDWVGSAIDRNRTYGCCFNLGSTMVSWFNNKQNYVALSLAKVEYITTSATSKEVVWIQKLLANLYGLERDVTLIF